MEEKVTIDFSVNELNIILGWIKKGPFEDVAELVARIISEAQTQLSEQPKAPEPEVPSPQEELPLDATKQN